MNNHFINPHLCFLCSLPLALNDICDAFAVNICPVLYKQRKCMAPRAAFKLSFLDRGVFLVALCEKQAPWGLIVIDMDLLIRVPTFTQEKLDHFCVYRLILVEKAQAIS